MKNNDENKNSVVIVCLLTGAIMFEFDGDGSCFVSANSVDGLTILNYSNQLGKTNVKSICKIDVSENTIIDMIKTGDIATAKELCQEYSRDFQGLLIHLFTAATNNTTELSLSLHVENIIVALNEINDTGIVLGFLMAFPANSDDTRKLLMHALTLELDKEKTQRIIDCLRRFTTYRCMMSDRFKSKEWHEFRQCDLIKYVRGLLCSGNFKSAILILTRHYLGMKASDKSLTSGLKLDFDVRILELVPLNDVADPIFLDWIRSMLFPDIKDVSSRLILAELLYERVHAIEETVGGLQCAFSVGNVMMEAFETNSNTVSIGLKTPLTEVDDLIFESALKQYIEGSDNQVFRKCKRLHSQLHDLDYLTVS